MIRKKYPDKQKAMSLIKSAKDEIDFTLKKLEVSNESSNTIVRNINESFRMMGESLLINQGIGFIDHVNSINELLKLDVKTERPVYLIESLRKLRNNINYYGYKAGIEEAKDAISIANSCFDALFSKVKKTIEKN